MADSALAEQLGLDPLVLDQLCARVGSPSYDAWDAQVRRCRACAHPMRLRGRKTEDGRIVFDTDDEPDGVLLKACGTRRRALCEPCSAVYAKDVFHLTRAGIAGGEHGVPTSVGAHPMAFATLTAPSFGAVHRSTEPGERCRPRRRGDRCPHGHPRGCSRRHDAEDPCVGQPLCPDCYDYQAAVLFNRYAPELWCRFTIALRRALAAEVGLSERALKDLVRVQYAKVWEFQKRGAVHAHAMVRLDARTDDPTAFEPPPIDITAAQLARAVDVAASKAALAVSVDDDTTITVAFGAQTDVRAIRSDGATGSLTAAAVAGYLAKYVTKAAEDFGIGTRPLTPEGARHAGANDHVVRLVETAHALGQNERHNKLLRWTHQLGFGGHYSSKSRRYSTTLGRIRQIRADYQRRAERTARGLPPEQDADVIVEADWRFAGTGYTTAGDALLAASAAARAREHQALVKEVRDELRAA